MSNIGIIVGREFNERVRKKSFIVMTILMPLLVVAMMIIPSLIMLHSTGDTKRVAVIDHSGIIAPQLESGEEIQYEPTDLSVEDARTLLTDYFGVLEIGADVMTNPNCVRLYANGSTSLAFEESLEDDIVDIIEREKLKEHNIHNLDEILAQVKTSVTITTFRNDEQSEEADEQTKSSAISTAIGFILGMMLYFILILYGAMVMQSVIEEKNSRVLEVMVSSVKPFELMMGKILGIATVAAVQILIWGVLIIGASAVAMPALVPADVMQSVEAMQAGTLDITQAEVDLDLLNAIGTATDVQYISTIFVWLLLFTVGGYLLYSAIFAAIGSSVDSVQDAQQLQTPVMLPIIISIFVMMTIFNDPNSPVAVWCSYIPFTSPIVMMARIPCGIPTWEIVLSLGILYASFVVMVWLAAKIYRVGIFMYGKKPSFKELWKWMRYKY
ncbi:MAG: ABC transporter permease [Alistipes sp.]|nr:ABC transporter permease [Alistipes sp.]